MPTTQSSKLSSSYNPPQSPSYHALRSPKISNSFGKGDVLVLFGELFQRGYANGLVEAAQKRGMSIIYATVGRRENGKLRPLNSEEIAQSPKPLINIPLEAGFDLEPFAGEGTATPVEQLQDLGLKDWEGVRLDWKKIEASRDQARSRFRKNVS